MLKIKVNRGELKRQQGATMAEYVLLVALIAIAVIVSVIALEGSLSDNLDATSDCVTSVVGGSADNCPGGTADSD